MKMRSSFILFILMPIVFLLFHNCGKFTSAIQKNSLSSASCINNLQPVFQSTMYDFFNSHNCTDCHREGGTSGKYFANSNPVTAFQIFLTYGSDRVKSKLSQSGGHSGNNYNADTNLKQSLDTAKAAWDSSLANLVCNDDSARSSEKTINFFESAKQFGKYKVLQTMLDPQKISWQVKPDLIIEAEIQIQQDEFSFPTFYFVGNIRAKSATPYHIKKIKIYLNGKTYDVTTFEGVDNTLIGSGNFETIYDGATAVFSKDENELYENADKWSISADIAP